MNSTTKIIAGVAVLALLFAAVGYAAYNGTAKTYNGGNEAAVEYTTLAFANWTPFTGDEGKSFAFDTYTGQNGDTTEKITVATPVTGTTVVEASTIDSTKEGKLAEIGSKELSITNNTSAAISSFTLDMAAIVGEGNLPTAGAFTYYVYVELGDNKQLIPLAATMSANFAELQIEAKLSATITITLYLGYEPGYSVPEAGYGPVREDPDGLWTAITADDVDGLTLDNVVFTFTAKTFA